MTRAAQGRAGAGPLRRPGGEELPRGTGKEPSSAGPQAHSRNRSRSACPSSTRNCVDATALHRLQLVQEKMDLEKELEQIGAKVDLSALEAAFVKTAGTYAERKGISYAAWRQLGVSADDAEEGGHHALSDGAAVGGAASSERSSTTPSSEPRRASLARSGCGMSPTTLPDSLAIPAMSSRLPLGLST